MNLLSSAGLYWNGTPTSSSGPNSSSQRYSGSTLPVLLSQGWLPRLIKTWGRISTKQIKTKEELNYSQYFSWKLTAAKESMTVCHYLTM